MDNTHKDITVGNTTYIMDEDTAIELLNAMSREFGWDSIDAAIFDEIESR